MLWHGSVKEVADGTHRRRHRRWPVEPLCFLIVLRPEGPPAGAARAEAYIQQKYGQQCMSGCRTGVFVHCVCDPLPYLGQLMTDKTLQTGTHRSSSCLAEGSERMHTQLLQARLRAPQEMSTHAPASDRHTAWDPAAAQRAPRLRAAPTSGGSCHHRGNMRMGCRATERRRRGCASAWRDPSVLAGRQRVRLPGALVLGRRRCGASRRAPVLQLRRDIAGSWVVRSPR